MISQQHCMKDSIVVFNGNTVGYNAKILDDTEISQLHIPRNTSLILSRRNIHINGQ